MSLTRNVWRQSIFVFMCALLILSMFPFLAFGSEKAVAAADDNYKVIGYYPSWGAYGRNYQVNDMNVSNVTHINYAFADICWNGRHGNPDPTGPNPVTWSCQDENSQTINVPNGTIVLGDPWIDTGKRMGGDPWDAPYSGNLAELNRLKQANPHLKTLISVGGWTWSNRFSDVAADPATREVFADSAVDFLRKYNFDGVDLDWEYPVGGGLAGNSVRAEDGANYILLLQKIREKLDAAEVVDGKYYELTIASGASPAFVQNNDLGGIAQIVDFINIMTYDFNGGWQNVSAHNAPLFYDPAATAGGVPNAALFNAAAAVQGHLDAGVPPHKLVMGVPFYGRGWGGCNSEANGQYQSCGGTATVGTWENGMFDYTDLVNNYINKGGYTRHWNDQAKVPFLYNPTNKNFISYDDIESINHKADFIKSKGLGGAMFWEFSADRNSQLLNKLTNELSGPRVPTETEPPSIPSNLRVTDISPYSVNLAWDASTDNVGVAGYIVTNGLTSMNVSNTSMTFGGLNPNTLYNFTVRAVDTSGNQSAPSHSISATTEESNDVTAPTPPSNLQMINATTNSITLSWTASSDDVGVAGYQVTYESNSISTTETMATLTGLTPNKTYSFNITARDAAGNISSAATIQASTLAENACTNPEWNAGTVYTGGDKVSYSGKNYEAKWWTQGDIPGTGGEYGVWKWLSDCSTGNDGNDDDDTNDPDTTAPTAPANIRLLGTTSSSISLAWDASTDNVSVAAYDIYNGSALAASTSSTTATIAGLAADTLYTFTVVAKDVAGNMSDSSAVLTARTNQQSTPEETSDKIMIGYWHNFDNGSTNIRLRDISPAYDIIQVAFAEPVGGAATGNMQFVPYNATIEQFQSDVAYLQSQGKKVLISIGGANGTTTLTSSQAKQTFVNTMKDIITTYGFDGMDIDLEGDSLSLNAGDTDFRNPTTPKVINLIDATREIANSYGPDFILTMAPETAYVQGGYTNYGGPWGAYLPVIHGLRDILDYLHVQHYNTGSMIGLDGKAYSQGTADFHVAMAEMMIVGFPVAYNSNNIFPGLRQNQVLIGVPSAPQAAGGGFTASTEMIKALNYLIKGESYGGTYVLQNAAGYPGFKGLMTWSINWDLYSNGSFSNAYRNFLNSFGSPEQPGTDTQAPSAPSNLRSTATTSSSISLAWNSSTDNVGVVGYTVAYGTSSVNVTETTATISGLAADSSYTFIVTAKDQAGNISNASNSLTVRTKQMNEEPVEGVAWQAGVAYNAGDEVTYNGKLYTCRQSHTSLQGWEPTNVPALWMLK